MKAVFYIVFLAVVIFKHGESVRCWTCSSDQSSYCDPLVTLNVRLVDCDKDFGTYTYRQAYRTVCKTEKKLVNGRKIVSRGCSWKTFEDTSPSCLTSLSSLSGATSFCETCNYDGCNITPAQNKPNIWRDVKTFFKKIT